MSYSNEVQGHWRLLKDTVRRKWGSLTDEEITIVDGKREVLVGRLEAKYGYTKEKAEAEADAWAKSL
jgi:uncharacterized protein YjbJ (UPF0337 family)